MKVPLSWLEDFVDIEISPQVLAEKLTNIGFEIEDLQYLYSIPTLINLLFAS